MGEANLTKMMYMYHSSCYCCKAICIVPRYQCNEQMHGMRSDGSVHACGGVAAPNAVLPSRAEAAAREQ